MKVKASVSSEENLIVGHTVRLQRLQNLSNYIGWVLEKTYWPRRLVMRLSCDMYSVGEYYQVASAF